MPARWYSRSGAGRLYSRHPHGAGKRTDRPPRTQAPGCLAGPLIGAQYERAGYSGRLICALPSTGKARRRPCCARCSVRSCCSRPFKSCRSAAGFLSMLSRPIKTATEVTVFIAAGTVRKLGPFSLAENRSGALRGQATANSASSIICPSKRPNTHRRGKNQRRSRWNAALRGYGNNSICNCNRRDISCRLRSRNIICP